MSSIEYPEAYIPIDRRLAMVSGQNLPDRMYGTALFADISGFTPLTETLAKELGPKRGAEEVTKHLNLVYDALIAEVDRYQGSVIGFCGDAITCWFHDDEGLRAIACGLAMQQIMNGFTTLNTPSGSTISLAIKVAIAAGPVRRFCVGDPHIQVLDVLAGATLDQLAAAEHQANKGEIVASSEVVKHLENHIKIAEWRLNAETGDRYALLCDLASPVAACPWDTLALEALNTEQVRPWILPQVFDRLNTGQSQYMAELRPAVAMFTNFRGIDYDREDDAGEKLDAYIHWIQGILACYEGFLIQLTIGDKGSYFYSAFGAPIAHDDDPTRALSAALELQYVPPELGYISQIQIGIGRGRMRVGPYGGKTRRAYGVLGDETNLAARLMSKAEPGQILVSQAMADAVGSCYPLQPIGATTLKGRGGPVSIYRVLDRASTIVQRPVPFQMGLFVGRETELAQINQILETVLSCQGQVLRLLGPAGIGKSRLAAEMVTRAGASGFRCAQGVCQSTSLSAYGPWRQVFRDLLGLNDLPHAGKDVAEDYACQIGEIERFIHRANREWLLRLPLLGDLLGLPVADNATTAAFEPRMRQSALFDLLAEMVQFWAKAQPVLLEIDDAHWMDESSRNLTLALSRSIARARVLLVVVHRPPIPDAPILEELDRLPIHNEMILGELSTQGEVSLLTQRLGSTPNSLALSLIQAETQGNPLFIEEVCSTLVESGQLVKRPDGSWGLSETLFQALKHADLLEHSQGHWSLVKDANLSAVDLGLPDSIQGIVLARIDRLPEAHRLTLKVASVIGRLFSLDVLANVHPFRPDEETLLAQAQLLEARDFTYLENPARRLFGFTHSLIHDVTYETLLYDQRRTLHQSVGEVLERLAPEAIEQLAYHTFLGQDWHRAFHYQMETGKKAKKLFANKEGIEHYKKALQSAEYLPQEQTVDQRQQAHASLGELLAMTGEYDLALQHLQEALALSAELKDREAQARACRWIAYVYEFRSDYPSALEWIDRGLQKLEAQQTAATAELLAIAGLIQTRQGNYDRAKELCEECIHIAEALGEITSLAFAHNSRAIIDYSQGNSSSAIQHFHKSAELYQQVDNIHGQALSYNGMGNAYQSLGQWPEADACLRQASEIFCQTGDELHHGFANNNLGEIARFQGRLDEALEYYQAALHSLELTGSPPYLLGILRMNLGATYVRKEEINSANPHLQASQAYFKQAGARDYLPELHRYLAEAALLAGEITEAERLGQQAFGLSQELKMRGEEGNTLRSLGQCACARGDLNLAEQYFVDSIMVLNEVGHEYESTCSQLLLAKVHLSQNNSKLGLAELEHCIQTFEKLGACLDLATASALKNKFIPRSL